MCDYKRDLGRCRFGNRLEEMKYLFKLILSFLRSGIKAKRGVEYRHSTCNALKFNGKWGTECLNTSPLQTLLFTGYSVKLVSKFNL